MDEMKPREFWTTTECYYETEADCRHDHPFIEDEGHEILKVREVLPDTPHADGVMVPRDVIDKILGYTWNAENSERLAPLQALSRGGK